MKLRLREGILMQVEGKKLKIISLHQSKKFYVVSGLLMKILLHLRIKKEISFPDLLKKFKLNKKEKNINESRLAVKYLEKEGLIETFKE